MDIEEKYNLLIIGGGPAAVKFLYNLLRTSKYFIKLHRLP